MSPERVQSAAVFDGPLRELIHAFKYHGKDYLAPVLAGYWLKRTRYRPDQIDVVVAVPMPGWKRWKRGFNQSELLAREVARAWNKPVLNDPLSRRLFSTSQTVLTRKARFRNARASFTLKYQGKGFEGLSVLLFDDVCTTGATLEACAELLSKAGAKRVWAGVIARELLK